MMLNRSFGMYLLVSFCYIKKIKFYYYFLLAFFFFFLTNPYKRGRGIQNSNIHFILHDLSRLSYLLEASIILFSKEIVVILREKSRYFLPMACMKRRGTT
jgi:hypothetical protein